MKLSDQQIDALTKLVTSLIDQRKAWVVVPPQEAESGFWFGGGNISQDASGSLWISGRYRNHGDSRTGLRSGARGLECALFKSDDGGKSLEKIRAWSKSDLSYPDKPVLSIEGTALHALPNGSWELFVSTEKAAPYPEAYAPYQKEGTGVWTIDRVTGPSPEALDARTLEPVLASLSPQTLHVKDPAVYDEGGTTHLLFCTHPISWASSNTGLACRDEDEEGTFEIQSWQLVPRGSVWDVAVTRVTDRLEIPRLGVFEGAPRTAVLFYDGAESMRQLDENPQAHTRPRGYSCEEIGGALVAPAGDLTRAVRLSTVAPLFTSPYGTRSSRYVSTLVTEEGIYATWQQAQPDDSQPLVMNFLPSHEVRFLLGG